MIDTKKYSAEQRLWRLSHQLQYHTGGRTGTGLLGLEGNW